MVIQHSWTLSLILQIAMLLFLLAQFRRHLPGWPWWRRRPRKPPPPPGPWQGPDKEG